MTVGIQVSAARPRVWWASLGLMLVSGFAGLGYQIVWTQQCAVWLGHEAAAVFAVVTAFFGGLAAGAAVGGHFIERSRFPQRWYAGCELLIGVWSLLLTVVMPWLGGGMLDLIGIAPTPLWQWSVAFYGTFLMLLPATAAMGSTLPAMLRIVGQANAGSRSVATLYSGNTFGAVCGVLAIAFVLIPQLGLLHSAYVCIAANILCAVVALLLFRAPTELTPRIQKKFEGGKTWLLGSLAVTGLLGIGYEVLVVRVLSQVAQDTVYTFAILLAIYLVGGAIGAALYQRWFAERYDDQRVLNGLLGGLATACLIGILSLWGAEWIGSLLARALGASMTTALAGEALAALAAFGLPTLVMGALFSHLSARAIAAGLSFGSALGANTLGAAAAPALFGVLAFPTLGPKFALLCIVLGYLLLEARSVATAWMNWIPAAALAALALSAPPLAFIDIPEGGHVVSYQEGVLAAVSVVEDADGVSRLRIDNRQQEGSSASLRFVSRMALLPLLLHPAPRHALFLGLGTGVTATAAAADTRLDVDAVELLPEVVAASRYFRNSGGADDQVDSPLHLMVADARRYVRASTRTYDVIVSDNFHPARSGSGSLYTVEHFQAVRNRLADGGLFCQWLPLHQLDLQTTRSIVRSFLIAYPHGWAMLANNSLQTPVLGLLGTKNRDGFDVAALRERLAQATPPQQLAQAGIEDEFAVLGGLVAGPSALRMFAGTAAINTDDHPVVAYRAPHITYQPDSLPRDRLLKLLGELSIAPEEVIASPASDQTSMRLTAYWRARNRFIESGRDVQPSNDPAVVLAQVREPLLAVLRMSPDFRPAYDPLLWMATGLGETDRDGARALLTELETLQPARPEAAIALERIGVSKP